MNLEKKSIDSLSSSIDFVKDSEQGTGFVSKRCNISEFIPVAEGHNLEEAKIIADSYHNLRLNPHEKVENTYVDFVCRKTQELSQPIENNGDKI